MNSFNNNIAAIMGIWTSNGACSIARGIAYQDAYSRELKIAKVKMEIVFNNVIERILIEFNVGR